jgi:myo-inositol 2-dehydrogenase/D-chiro-inositol 1-dehydrogenase
MSPANPEITPTRRDFVAAGAVLATAGTAIAQAVASAPVPTKIPTGTIRVGLIGCGGRGTGAAAQALQADPDVTLVAMGDAFQDRLDRSVKNLSDNKEVGDRVDVPIERQHVGLDAYTKVLAEDVDVVILTTPPYFRPSHLEAAVNAGKHVFCEKPMAVDGPGVRSVIASAKKAQEQGTCMTGGFCWRYALPERATYAKIHEGAIGDVTSVYTNYLTGTLGRNERKEEWTDLEWQLRNWWHFHWLSGDHIVEQACHAIDKLSWAKNDVPPIACTAVGGRQCRTGPESGNAWDHFAVVFEYEDGTRCHHDCRQTPNCHGDNSDYITGSKGTARVNGWSKLHRIRGEQEWDYDGEYPSMYQVEHNELFKAIREGTPTNDGHQMTTSTLMAIMGRQAAYSGQKVTWEQALNSQETLGPEVVDWTVAIAVDPVAMPGVYKLT